MAGRCGYASSRPSSRSCVGGESRFDVERCLPGGFVGSSAALARDHVSRVPAGPVMLRRGWLVGAMALLGFLQELRERRHVEAEPPSGKTGLHLLKNPAIAIGIGERRVR